MQISNAEHRSHRLSGEQSLLSPRCLLLGWSNCRGLSLLPGHSPGTPQLTSMGCSCISHQPAGSARCRFEWAQSDSRLCRNPPHLPSTQGPWPSCPSQGPSSSSYLLSGHALGPQTERQPDLLLILEVAKITERGLLGTFHPGSQWPCVTNTL